MACSGGGISDKGDSRQEGIKTDKGNEYCYNSNCMIAVFIHRHP